MELLSSQFQPRKKENKKDKKANEDDFEFITSAEDYNKDTWNDLSKYIKRKVKTKVDDKIKKFRKTSSQQVNHQLLNCYYFSFVEINKWLFLF